jgi:hypothetical protein
MAKTDLRAVLFLLIVAALVVACSGGSEPPVTPINSTSARGAFAPSLKSAELPKAERRQRIALNQTGKALKLPSTAAMAEHITLPANDAPPGASLEVTISNALPQGVARLPAREVEAFMSFTLEASANVTLHGIPKFSVRLRSKPANHGAFYAWAFIPKSGWRDFGPLTVSGNVLTFGGSRQNLNLKQGVVYAVIPFTAAVLQGCPTPSPTPLPTPTPTATPTCGPTATSAPTPAHGTLFVASGSGDLFEYAPPNAGSSITLHGGGSQIAMSPSGDLFENGNGITELTLPYTQICKNFFPSLPGNYETGLAVNRNGDLFVATDGFEPDGQPGAGYLTEIVPPYSAAPIVIPTLGTTAELAIDSAGDVFDTVNGVTEYAPPYTNGPKAVFPITAFGLAFNPSDDLFISNINNATVSEYAPPYTGPPMVTFSTNAPAYSIAVDSSGDVFAANGSNVLEFAPPYTGAPIATFPVPSFSVAVFP